MSEDKKETKEKVNPVANEVPKPISDIEIKKRLEELKKAK